MNSILFSITLFLISIHCVSGEYGTQETHYLDVVEGDSATIFCSFQQNIDIRGFSFKKSRKTILQICFFSNENFTELSLSGTIENLQCEFKTEAKSTCTVRTDLTETPEDDPCPPPPENSAQKSLYHGNKIFASISVDRGYTSRLDISGNVWNLNFTLEHLTLPDSGSFSCGGNAEHIGEFYADSTQLTVNKKGSMGTLKIIFIVLLIVLIIIICSLAIWKPNQLMVSIPLQQTPGKSLMTHYILLDTIDTKVYINNPLHCRNITISVDTRDVIINPLDTINTAVTTQDPRDDISKLLDTKDISIYTEDTQNIL
ncbi:uncharacterized protein LOC130297665 [Hyla sarda]|uniref:uncharacterized protein LOC130297665 n=1 Tax=Hyla sarda TaxID=327740 RepID=UPI0024C4116E|nr:uncharacterized protein LOC130297665 [Hyla sarda]